MTSLIKSFESLPTYQNYVTPVITSKLFFPSIQICSTISICFQGIQKLYYELFQRGTINKLRNYSIIEPSGQEATTHGAALLSSGLLNGVSCLKHILFSETATKIFFVTGKISGITFISACLLAIKHNIYIYHSIPSEKCQGEDPLSRYYSHQRRSAMMGILNNLGQLVSTALLLAEVATVGAFILAAICGTIGLVKMIYDYVISRREGSIETSTS